jgi:hypothetical protein
MNNDVMYENPNNQRMGIPSKKEINRILFPQVGTDIMGCKVIYVHAGRHQITIEGQQHLLPSAVGLSFDYDSKIFEVTQLDLEKNRYSAVFRGFKQNPIVEAPEEVHDEEIVKVI